MSKSKARKKRAAKRAYKLPMEYIEAVSDRIFTTSPTKQIINNTLVGMSSVLYSKGYARRMADEKYFRDKRNKTIADNWNLCKDAIDDIIHPNTNQPTI
jgi:hypothetical protein